MLTRKQYLIDTLGVVYVMLLIREKYLRVTITRFVLKNYYHSCLCNAGFEWISQIRKNKKKVSNRYLKLIKCHVSTGKVSM